MSGKACRVVTDEVGMGKDAAHLRETDESLMHRGHDLWLATLKWVAEGHSLETDDSKNKGEIQGSLHSAAR